MRTISICRRDYFTVSAPALHATASWSPVAPLQPTAPMIFPPSMSGNPPGDAVGGGESSVAIDAGRGLHGIAEYLRRATKTG